MATAKLTCCARGTKYVAPRFDSNKLYDFDSAKEFRQFVKTTKPSWVVLVEEFVGRGEFPRRAMEVVQACPFCATPVPDLKLHTKLPRTVVVADGGYYCATCKERLNECECPHPEELWKIA